MQMLTGQSEKEFLPRILRDMRDDVLALNTKGEILYLNEQGRALLGEGGDPTGQKYASLMAREAQERNDAFHQFVVDAVYDKVHAHSGEVNYVTPGGEERRFRMTSSFLRDETRQERLGVVVLFSDITEVARLQRQRREASIIFALLMIFVCVHLFLWQLLLRLGIDPRPFMTLMIEGVSLIMFFIIIKTTSFSIHDIGLRVTDARATFVPDLLITAAVAAALVLGKLALLRVAPGFFPAGAPFWDWSVGTVKSVFYPLTVILQEFLARGVIQENLRRIFYGKHAGALSIVVSALIFGALHIFYGLTYMLAASLLLGVLGILYNKQRNIWGLSIIHCVLGQVATFLRYI